MKTKLITIAAIALAATSAHATLIDETPGGFTGFPPIFLYVLGGYPLLHQVAGANINGEEVLWSQFEPFGPDQFSITTDGVDAFVSWNLEGTDSWVRYILLEGVGAGADHIYRVRGSEARLVGDGLVTIDGVTHIQSIIFYGSNIVPEAGATIALFALALLALGLLPKLPK
jgi:hypothetical protein